ncbi:armadillo-type protein [Biscogniauxia marginata]|nr:armadillo-type protein [Biscogniauxia marginata]
MSLREIDQLFTSPLKDEASQTDALRQVESAASSLWETSPDSPDIELLAQKAGDAAREEHWRVPLGASGLLAFFCRLIGTPDLRSPLIIHALRAIGNSCADKDENRERVITSGCLPKIVALLNDDSLLAFVIPVLFNVCVDYEPAQKAIYKAGINPALVNIISGPRLENASSSLTNIICKLFVMITTQETEEDLVDLNTPFALLNLAMKPEPLIDLEDFLGLTSAALTYLFEQQFQQAFLQTPHAVGLAIQAFQKACGSSDFDISEIDADDQEALKQVQLAFMQTFAELSANALFASSCPLDGPEAQTLQRWISTPNPLLQSTACLALGNIARDDEACTLLVQKSRIHEPLIALLSEPSNDTDPQLLHSVLSFLKNLAIPAGNKVVLSDAGLLRPQVLPRIWGFDVQPQIQFDATSLARMLLVNCLDNVRRICVPLGPDHDRSGLQLLVDLHERSDQEPTKTETARAVAMACRVLHSSSPPPAKVGEGPTSDTRNSSDSDSNSDNKASYSLREFYDSHPTLTDTMAYLGLQEKFPALRSEFLFVFALMARSLEGAEATARSMQNSRLVAMLVKAVTGQECSEEGGGSNKTSEEVGMPKQESLPEQGSGLHIGTTSLLSSADDDKVTSLGLEGLSLLAPQAPEQANNRPSQSKAVDNNTVPNVDRENGLVLIAELLSRCPTKLPPLTKTTFTSIFQTEGKQLSNKNSDVKE